jgi:N-hydroxyarylamine O-acetyltransferase
MSPEPADIDRYCARIGYSGSREPTLAVLQAIVAGHTTAIPFENLDVLAQRSIRLDLPSLREKLVRLRRGGYCYEHNLLLLDVLLGLSFQAVGLLARVRLGVPTGVVTPRSHMLLRIDLEEGPHIADVGFGMALTAPLRLAADIEQTTPNETFRLIPVGGEYDLQAKFGDTWGDLYRLSLQEQMSTDYEAANWYTSTHPNSLFVRNLIASRPGPNRRHTLFNDKFTIRHGDGKVERRTLKGTKEFGDVLAHYFAITLPDAADIKTIAAVAEERAANPDIFDRSGAPPTKPKSDD